MKKLMLAAMLAMAVVGVPAIADVEQPSSETTSPSAPEATSPSILETTSSPIPETTSPSTPETTTPPALEATSPPISETTTPPSADLPPPPTDPPPSDAAGSSPRPAETPPDPPAEKHFSLPLTPSSVEEDSKDPEQPSKVQEGDNTDVNQEADNKANDVASEQRDNNDPPTPNSNSSNTPRNNRWNDPPSSLWGVPPNHQCNFPRDNYCNNNSNNDPHDSGTLDQKIGQEAHSGDVNQSANVTNTGNNVNQCVAVLQAANSGNLQNGQGAAQDRSKAGDIQVGGSRISVTPQLVQDCRQIILQVTAAQQNNNVGGAKALRSSSVLGSEAAIGGIGAGGLQGNVINPLSVVGPGLSVGQPRVGQALVAPVGRLPRTGGLDLASLLTLGAGFLLIGGGLLTRRLSR